MSTQDLGWRNWTAEDWNKALFKHFFCDSDGEDRPVNRLLVTRDELVKIVSEPGADAQQVEKSFLRVVQTPSHINYNHRLSGYPIDSKTGWSAQTIPPFFFELAFSCLVASPPDGEIRTNGDFRRRLAMLLGHDQNIANYPLDRLTALWVAFSKWLDWRRQVGEPYRRLELPPLDYRVRIGYSINLAFPSIRDQVVLTKVLSKGGFDGDPPIQAVFDLVGKEVQNFSLSFRRAYDEFRDAFTGKEKELERFPFWGAVRAAVKSALDEESEGDAEGRRLKLVLEAGGMVLLLSTVPGDVIRDVLAFVEVDNDYGEFGSVLCLSSTSGPSFHQATRRLLGGRYTDRLSGKGWKAINVAVEQGLLLFRKTESLFWELTTTRPEDGEIQALVMNFLTEDFLKAFPKNSRPHHKPSSYDGWTEIERFPGELLNSLEIPFQSPLTAIRCLQTTVQRPRLSFVGGCPIDCGFLGIPACLPIIRAPLSDAVQAMPVDGKNGRGLICLTRVEEDSVDFTFPIELVDPLNGRYRLVGSRDCRVLIQREVTFYPEIVVNAYARPTDPGAWEEEAGGPDVVTYGDAPNGDPCPSDGSKRPSQTMDENAMFSSHSIVRISRLKSPPSTWPRKENFPSPKKYSGWEPSEFVRAVRFMEVCGGFAMRRKGISEIDLLDLVRDCLAVDQYDQQWDVIRAWVEGGYLDRLHYKRWRRTAYFPRVPRFVLEARGGHIRGVLFGLATSAFRNRADVELLELGVQRTQVASPSNLVLPALAWKAPSEDPYLRVSKTLGLEEPVWMKPIVETLWSLSDVIASREGPPLYYERSGCWTWDHGWFSRYKEPTEEGVEVIRLQRPDRPILYQVTLNGEHVWWSTSRNWSLLLAHELRNEAVFAIAKADQVVRVSKGKIYLPLPIGRYLAATGDVAPGPSGDCGQGYVYQFRDPRERLCILSAIWGNADFDSAEMGRWARSILAMSRRPTLSPGVQAEPLPRSLKRGLEQFHEVPEFRELSRVKLDPSLVPHIRKGLSKFTKLMEG